MNFLTRILLLTSRAGILKVALPGKLFLASLVLLIFFPGLVKAQKTVEHQQLIWLRYGLGLALSEKFELHNEIEERRYVFPGKQHQLLFRSTLLYNLNEGWQPGAGFTYFLQSPHDPRSVSDLMVPELRPHQEINYRLKISERWNLRQRFKMEERFFRKTSNNELADGYNFNFRFRIKADVYYTVLKDKAEKDLVSVFVSDEVMFNAGNQILYNVFDQNRVAGGLRWHLGKSAAVEGGYVWWYQQRPDGVSFFNRNILRFSFFHKFSLFPAAS